MGVHGCVDTQSEDTETYLLILNFKKQKRHSFLVNRFQRNKAVSNDLYIMNKASKVQILATPTVIEI